MSRQAATKTPSNEQRPVKEQDLPLCRGYESPTYLGETSEGEEAKANQVGMAGGFTIFSHARSMLHDERVGSPVMCHGRSER